MFGKVQQYNELKGFGFLLQKDNFRERVYFHITSWVGDVAPKVGMRVSYDLAPSKKVGMPPQAVNVTPIVTVPQTADENDLFVAVMNASSKVVKL
jgi:cold shock CspA family protein